MEINFSKLEKKILKYWQENKIFEKSIKRRKRARNFVFYEGPPTANAKPGLHHVLARVFKDIICRYKTMQGFRVLRKAGWDTHGLPVELEIEKKLGLKSKKDIERYGIAKFNKKCQESVWQYKKNWEKLTEKIGFWLDMENPYITYKKDYIESIWWILKEAHQKGLLYQDYKVVPYCPRCGTSLSSHEVALGYKAIREPAIYLKLRIKNPEFKDSYLLVWTTTPWTLPGNVAVAVNPQFTYVKVKVNGEHLILAQERMQACGFKSEQISEKFKGKDLVDLRYEPLYPTNYEVSKKAYRVITADFVSLKEGTGLVHLAPAFGEEDMEAGKENDLPVLLNVDGEGRFTLEVKKWAGMFVKDADPLIIEDLKNRNLLFKKEDYLHDYPFCWRCDSLLLYYAKKSWFIRMTKIKKDLVKNNRKINWVPLHLKEGRFGEWLKEIKDWALSRERYWGTPLPVWQCKKCGNSEIIGSFKEILAQKFSTNNYYILRHGQSLRQIKDLSMCWPEKIHCPLTKKGEEEVLRAAEKLKEEKIDLIFSSNLLRTKQTAQIISKELGVKIIFDKRLREYNVGIFNGKNPKLVWEYLTKSKDLISAKPPKGESLIKIQQRMYGFLKELEGKYQDKNILIISHELPLSILEGSLKGWPLEKTLAWRKRKGAKTIQPGKLREIKFKNLPYNEKMELDLHRPYIDEIKFFCQKCKKLTERVPEVIDVWFDSGSMPFAQGHWPFAQNQKSKIKSQKINPPELFPADYISEAIDQTRGWFYTLLAISTLLGFGPAFKNVISLGHILDEKGEKMSKSRGNVVDPWQILEKYSSDATRWYFFTINQPGDSKLFSEKDVAEALRKFIMTFWNSYLFFQTYGQALIGVPKFLTRRKNVLDGWIVSRLNKLISEITKYLNNYEVTRAARLAENFIINDLSLWYIRRSRKRFQKPKDEKELKETSETLGFLLLTLSKLTAPFIPFLSEEIYRGLKADVEQSVHLADWPRAKKSLIDEKLEQKMAKVRETITQALAERAKAGIKVRQPLQKLKIKNEKLKVGEELLKLIKEEVNVKEIVFDAKIKKEVELDTKVTLELKEEGILREIIRSLQEMRKEAGFKPKDLISIQYSGEAKLTDTLVKNKESVLRETKAGDLKGGQRGKVKRKIIIEGKKLSLGIKKVAKIS